MYRCWTVLRVNIVKCIVPSGVVVSAVPSVDVASRIGIGVVAAMVDG